MKKKIINGLLLLAVTTFGCSTFTSCKDDVSDLQTEVNKNDEQLQKQIDELKGQLKAAQEACKTECTAKYNEILELLKQKAPQADFTKLKNEFEAFVKSLDGKTWTKADLQKLIENYGYITASALSGYVKDEDLQTDLGVINGKFEDILNILNGMNGEKGIVDQVKDLQTTVEQLKKDIANAGKGGITKEEAEKLIGVAKAELQGKIDALEASLGGRIGTLETDLGSLKETVKKINLTVEDINGQIVEIDGRLTTAAENAVNALAQAEANKSALEDQAVLLEGFRTKLEEAEGRLNGLDEAISALDERLTEVEALKAKVDDILDKIDALETKDTELEGRLNGIDETLGQYALDLEALTERVAANEDAIAALQQGLGKLQNRIDAMVTSMIVQGVYNPLFGTFSLPIGVQSNMLVNYYGVSEKKDFNFPGVQAISTLGEETEVDEDEYNVLVASGLVPYTVKTGEVMMNDNNGNLGKIFVTINPNNVDFTGKTLTLETSAGKPSKVELRNLRHSDEELTFGYSARSASNGFYEADATLPATMEAIAPTALHIDANLKSSIKEILKDKRSDLRSNVLHLMKTVYDQVNGMLPAYGLKAAWNVNGEDYAVFSNYNVAATTFKPLSFGFMYEQEIGRKLPIIDPLSQSIIDINKDKFKFTFDFDFELSGSPTFTIDFGEFDLAYTGADIELELNDIKVIIDGQEQGHLEGSAKLTGEDLQPLFNSLNEQLESQFGKSLSDEIQRQFQSAIQQVYDSVNEEVQKMLTKMEGQINTQLGNMIGDIQDEINNKVGNYIGKFNNFITRYNNLAKRINNVLADPNHYLQATMFYKAGNGGDYFLSNNPANPTVLVNEGGNAFLVYATTYTAEVAAPSFKKVVAITDVIDNATGKSVPGAVSECTAINKSADFLAEVCPGFQKRFAIPTSRMEAGKTYEILYTALDYHGVTSTARYYVTVK